jgi:hypothetical protein
MMGPEPRIRIFEMSVRLGIYFVVGRASLVANSRSVDSASSRRAGTIFLALEDRVVFMMQR